MPTLSQRVRTRRKFGLTIHWDDHPGSMFAGYNPTGLSDDKEQKEPDVVGGVATEAEAPDCPRVGGEDRARGFGVSTLAESKAKRRISRAWLMAKARRRTKPCEGSARVPRCRIHLITVQNNSHIHTHPHFYYFVYLFPHFPQFYNPVVVDPPFPQARTLYSVRM
jgi:hypothetical protein